MAAASTVGDSANHVIENLKINFLAKPKYLKLNLVLNNFLKQIH